jgi:hypothetical protein
VKGDWDVSNLLDVMPRDPYTSDFDTWPSSTANPTSRLDRFYITDSAVAVANGFILNTKNMSVAQLAAAGLQANDTDDDASADHLPVVIDLTIAPAAETHGWLIK